MNSHDFVVSRDCEVTQPIGPRCRSFRFLRGVFIVFVFVTVNLYGVRNCRSVDSIAGRSGAGRVLGAAVSIASFLLPIYHVRFSDILVGRPLHGGHNYPSDIYDPLNKQRTNATIAKIGSGEWEAIMGQEWSKPTETTSCAQLHGTTRTNRATKQPACLSRDKSTLKPAHQAETCRSSARSRHRRFHPPCT